MQDLETEIANRLASEISADIDFQILSNLFSECGWKKVELGSLLNRKRSIDILIWCEDNIKNKFRHRGSTFLFEDQGDAVNFTLKWL